MINLLPPIEKEKFILEKKQRIAYRILTLLLFLVFCVNIVALGFNYYLLEKIKQEQSVLTSIKEELSRTPAQEMAEKAKSANKNLKDIISFYKEKIYYSEILEEISKIIPSEISLTNLSIFSEKKKNEGQTIKVSLSGFAPTRKSLFYFRKKLKEAEFFRNVSFPPSNWIKPTDIDFSINFEVKPKTIKEK